MHKEKKKGKLKPLIHRIKKRLEAQGTLGELISLSDETKGVQGSLLPDDEKEKYDGWKPWSVMTNLFLMWRYG